MKKNVNRLTYNQHTKKTNSFIFNNVVASESLSFVFASISIHIFDF
ncbi:MAG: hypothetical protein PHX46_02720 [Bacilli bacterium]|nr:hypothetical protein [Bacilli bacterium]